MKKFTKFEVWILISVVIAIILLIIGVNRFILNHISSKVDVSAINANYWVSIMGSIIAGVLTLIGVVLTIMYYRNSDLEQRRLEYLPYLMISPWYEGCSLTTVFDAIYDQPGDVLKYNIMVKNIGNQYAQINEIYDGITSTVVGYNIVIPKGEERFILFKLTKESLIEGHIIYITYSDALGNKYLQTYCLRYPYEHRGYYDLQVDNTYPQKNDENRMIKKLFK